MATVYLSLGSNTGNRKYHIMQAVARLAERAGSISALSSLYVTAPWGFVSDHPFLNAAAALQTVLSPHELLALTQQIEKELGRTRKSDGEYHDRSIDIDILLYDRLVLSSPDLVIPHPLMHRRPFVLEPLSEIAPGLEHPVLHVTVKNLWKELDAGKTGR